MKFQITCAHCGTRFLVEGKSGQTIECQCPGCEGTMRVTLPKVSNDGSAKGKGDDADDYQVGTIPQQDNPTGGGDTGDDDKQRRRRMALGCLFGLVIIAAAAIAFFALNHTVKKPIEDPYEYVEPDTAEVDTVQQEKPEEEDTIIMHEPDSVPKYVAPDTTHHASEAEPSDEEVGDEPTQDAGDNHTVEPSGNSDQTSKSKSSKSDSKSSKSESSKQDSKQSNN